MYENCRTFEKTKTHNMSNIKFYTGDSTNVKEVLKSHVEFYSNNNTTESMRNDDLIAKLINRVESLENELLDERDKNEQLTERIRVIETNRFKH